MINKENETMNETAKAWLTHTANEAYRVLYYRKTVDEKLKYHDVMDELLRLGGERNNTRSTK
jgi:alpha-galactosidase/6-phospho-beta-glucosidase family protein